MEIQRLGNEMFMEKKIYEKEQEFPHARY